MKFWQWQESWCGIEPLKVSIPSLFPIAASVDAWVNDLWCGHEEGEGGSPFLCIWL